MPDPTAPSLITTNTRCINCTYSLRGLDRSALCPECGVPCRDSFPPIPFELSPPRHLRALASGIHRLEIALYTIMLSTAGALIVVALAALSAIVFSTTDWRRAPIPFIIFAAIDIIAGLLAITAVHSITQPTDPSAWLPPRAARAEKTRSFLRAMLALLTVAIFIVTAIAIGYLFMPIAEFISLIDAVAIAIGILAVIIIFSTATYLREITLRIPDHRLATRLVISARTTAVTFSIATLAAIFTNPIPNLSDTASRTIQSVAWSTLIASVLLTAFPLLYFTILLRRLRKHTGRALRANNPAEPAT